MRVACIGMHAVTAGCSAGPECAPADAEAGRAKTDRAAVVRPAAGAPATHMRGLAVQVRPHSDAHRPHAYAMHASSPGADPGGPQPWQHCPMGDRGACDL